MLANRRHLRFARVPFSLGAVIALIVSVGIAGYITSIDTERNSNVINQPIEDMDAVSRAVQEDMTLQAYYIALDAIRNVTEPSNICPSAQANFSKFLDGYPKKVEGYRLEILSHDYYLIFDVKSTTDHMTSLDLRAPSELCETARATYFRLVGKVAFMLTHASSGRILERIAPFDKNVYSPFPLLKGALDRFQANSIGEFTDIGRTVKFILTTLAQLRVLEGVAGGGYGPTARTSIEQVITQSDVEAAIQLAVLIEEARQFRDYDRDIANALGAGAMLTNFLTNGTIDAADIYLIFKGAHLEKIDAAKTIGQAIYSYLDEFLFELYCKFWGGLSSALYIDPTLSEPLRSFEFTKTLEVIDEGLAKQCLLKWFYNILDWLGFADTGEAGHILPSFEGTATLGTITHHFVGNDTVCGGNVEGDYELFSAVSPTGEPATWTVRADFIPSLESLVLGEADDPSLNAMPYSVTYYDNGWSGIDENVVQYYLVKKSFVASHWTVGSETPYRDALMYIVGCLDNSIRNKSASDADKGLVDTIASAASDTPSMTGIPEVRTILGDPMNADSIMHPKNNLTVISNGTGKIVGELEGMASDFEAQASIDSNRESWWRDGAYKQGRTGFIWALFKESMELIYEAMTTLQASAIAAETLDLSGLAQYQEKPSTSSAFNFRTDAMKDLFRRVFPIVDARVSEFNPIYWTNLTGHPEHSNPHVCPEVWEVDYAAGYASPEAHLWTDLHEMAGSALNGAFGGMSGYLASGNYVNTIIDATDNRAYTTNFYNFVTHTAGVGEVFIGDNGLVMTLARDWLPESLSIMEERILDNVELCNIEFLQNTAIGVPYELWGGNKADAQLNGSIMHESPRVKQRALRFDVVELADPGFGASYRLRIADVQDGAWNTSKAPFQSYWRLNISAELDISTWTDRLSIITKNSHAQTFANQTINIRLAMPIVAFSAWNLDDLTYSYTRGYFGVSGSDTREDPFFASTELTSLIENASITAGTCLDGVTRVSSLSAPIMSELYEKRYSLPARLDDAVQGFVRTMKNLDSDTPRKEALIMQFENISVMCAKVGIDTFQVPMLGIPDCEYNFSASRMGISDEFDYRVDVLFASNFSTTGQVRFANFEGELQVSPAETGSDQFVLIGLFELDGHIYQYSLYSPSATDADAAISTDSKGLGNKFSGMYFPMLGAPADVNVVVFGKLTSAQRANVDSAIEVAKKYAGHTPEHLIAFTKALLGHLTDLAHSSPNTKTINTTRFGITFELNFSTAPGGTYDVSGLAHQARKASYSVLADDASEMSSMTISKFIDWLVNQLRSYIYSFGRPSDATTPLSSLPWKAYEHSNARVRTIAEITEMDSTVRTEMTIPSTMQALPFANADYDGVNCGDHVGLHPRVYAAEFGRISNGKWSTKGTILGL